MITKPNKGLIYLHFSHSFSKCLLHTFYTLGSEDKTLFLSKKLLIWESDQMLQSYLYLLSKKWDTHHLSNQQEERDWGLLKVSN